MNFNNHAFSWEGEWAGKIYPGGSGGKGYLQRAWLKGPVAQVFWTLVYFWINSMRGPDFEVKRISIPAVGYSGDSKIV
jgi:hypothetical protein